MKIAKLTNVTAVEAAGLIVHLGGKELAYRDVPLLNESQIESLIVELGVNKTDALMFDTGAVFDRSAYELARDAVDAVVKAYPDRFKVIIFNTPDYGRRKETTADTLKTEV